MVFLTVASPEGNRRGRRETESGGGVDGGRRGLRGDAEDGGEVKGMWKGLFMDCLKYISLYIGRACHVLPLYAMRAATLETPLRPFFRGDRL
jgi:hypothetical protein